MKNGIDFETENKRLQVQIDELNCALKKLTVDKDNCEDALNAAQIQLKNTEKELGTIRKINEETNKDNELLSSTIQKLTTENIDLRHERDKLLKIIEKQAKALAR